MGETLSKDGLNKIHAYWRAANYLSVGQIYLYANPLLKEPLKLEHVKPRLLGHWGTTPGLNFIYVHLNRVIRKRDLNMFYVCGPGHGGPGIVANTYLEGTYSEVYPNISQDADGMQRLFKQFSFPGGIPSHAAPETPGSIHRVMQRLKLPVRFTREVNSGTPSLMRTGRPLIIPTSLSHVWSVTAKLNQGPSPLPGIQINF
jgi:xylulose-5-phosphate/fructose-6-phosphate phosphoketolase